jgi:hypothetical protein
MSDENDSNVAVESLLVVSVLVFVMTTSFKLYGGDTTLKSVEFGIGSAVLAVFATVLLIGLSRV